MDLEARHLLAGTLIALLIGGGYAWYQRQPQDAGDEPRAERNERDPTVSPGSNDAAAPKLYKWQDDQGVWNYTDQPPADRPYETIAGTPNVNSVPSVVPDSGVDDSSATPSQ